ncbi:MAG: hypothetical protein L6R35_006749, partial [Caloplaca aegaea]
MEKYEKTRIHRFFNPSIKPFLLSPLNPLFFILDLLNLDKHDPSGPATPTPSTVAMHHPKTPRQEQQWNVESIKDEHNHMGFENESFAYLRKLKAKQREKVIGLIRKGVKTRKIMMILQEEWLTIPVIPRDIWNLAFRTHRDNRSGHTTSEALARKLQDDREVFQAIKNERDQLIEGDTKKECKNFVAAWTLYIAQAKTMDTLREGIMEFRKTYVDDHFKKAVQYTLSLLKFKEHFVWCFTDQHIHYGLCSSLAIEEMHQTMKDYIERTRTDLYYVIQQVDVYLRDQWRRVTREMEGDMTTKAVKSHFIFSM